MRRAGSDFVRDRVKVCLYRPRHCAKVGGYHFTRARIKYLTGSPAAAAAEVIRLPFPCSMLS